VYVIHVQKLEARWATERVVAAVAGIECPSFAEARAGLDDSLTAAPVAPSELDLLTQRLRGVA
jgi:hypothetical protein